MTKKVEAEIPDRIFMKLMKRKEQDGFGDKGWDEWFTYVTRDVNIDPTVTEQVRKGTKNLLNMWCRNFADNLPLVREGRTLRDLMATEVAKPPDDRAVVIGRGPSVFRKKHLEAIKNSSFEGAVVATDGMLIECLESGIVPHYVLSVDGSPVLMKWFNHPLVNEHAKEIKAIINTQTNHAVAERIVKQGFDVYWFQPSQDSVNQEVSITKVFILMTCGAKNPDGMVALECGGNVGSTCFVFSWNVLKRPNVALIGLDFGYPDDMPLEDTYYYDQTVNSIGALQANTFYDRVWHPFWGTTSKMDIVFKSYRENFFDMMVSKPAWLRVVNCTEGGTLFHPGLECMNFRDWLSERKEEKKK